MGIISQVGRKNPRVRLAIAGIYLALTLGAISIVLPFIVMITMSVSSVTDIKKISLFPQYLSSDRLLFAKYLAEKGNEDINIVKQDYPVEGQHWLNWEQVRPGMHTWEDGLPEGMSHLLKDWDEFAAGLSEKFYKPAFSNTFSNGPTQYLFQQFLDKRYGGVEAFNKADQMDMRYLSTVNFPDDNWSQAAWGFDDSHFSQDYSDFKQQLSPEMRLVSALNPIYGSWLRLRYHDKIQELNAAWGSGYRDIYFNDVTFPSRPPSQPVQRRDWEAFVRERFPIHWVTAKAPAAKYQSFLKGQYKSLEEYDTVSANHYKSWDEVAFPSTAPHRDPENKDWGLFVATLPLESLTLDFPESLYGRMLEVKYGGLAQAAQAYGVDVRAPDGNVILPLKWVNECDFRLSRTHLKWHYLTYNYRMVLRFLLLQGRPFVNTGILVVLSIVTALTINPIAAYALSRFRYPYTQRILLFLLATAAFPAEVAAIPQFLLVKKFDMLNTFWALILPGIANGFWIFMLKGFFDSLPKELYEAAILDGAGEYTLFTKVTVPLAAPILALTAFGAFTEAYGSYLWNIIVANKADMWTITVALQQYMGGTTPPNMVMAAIVVSSIPTLLAFLLVQRAILKGIVIPTLH
jgi:multiple sugar transport system permease protein